MEAREVEQDMSVCTHHWTVTSECPRCLRAEIERLREAKDVAVDRYMWLHDTVIRHNKKKRAVVVEDFIAPIAYGDSTEEAIDAARKS
jgi:hypothetical protein